MKRHAANSQKMKKLTLNLLSLAHNLKIFDVVLAKYVEKIRQNYSRVYPKLDNLKGQYINTLDRKRFLLFDTRGTERIIAFKSDRQLIMLSQSSRWHVNGRFKKSPSIFVLLYLIHAWYKDEMNPCVFLLLPNRRKNTDLRMLRQHKVYANQMQLQLEFLKKSNQITLIN